MEVKPPAVSSPSIVSGPPSLQGQATTPQAKTAEPVVPGGVTPVHELIITEPSKPATQSLTVGFNGAIIVVSLVASLLVSVQPQLNQAILDNFRSNPELGVSLVTVLSSLFGLANVLIRIYRTSQPITH